MFLGISIVGWGILVAAYVPVVLLLRSLARRSGTRSKAFITTAALTSLPFVAAIGEAAYVESNWRALCATAKTEVKKKVVVEGFYDDGISSNYDHFRQAPVGFQHGFRFVEWKDKSGRIWRTEGFKEPELRTVQIDKPSARYQKHTDRFGTPFAHLIRRIEHSVVDTKTGEVIALKIAGARDPVFVDRLWRQWFDNVPRSCEDKRTIWGNALIGVDRKEESR